MAFSRLREHYQLELLSSDSPLYSPPNQIQFSPQVSMGEEESKKEGGDEGKPAEGKSGSLKTTIIAAVFTLIGGIIGVLGKGYYDLRIEDKKGDAELKLED